MNFQHQAFSVASIAAFPYSRSHQVIPIEGSATRPPTESVPALALCLSGGGFRATLLHLGVVRLLAAAGILSNVKVISSVSGGSILAAHLVLNWEDYLRDFGAAAKPLIQFTRSDVRGRLLRRFPRSRIAMIERLYARELYKERSLKHLRGNNRPELHILATNLTSGSPCCRVVRRCASTAFCLAASRGRARQRKGVRARCHPT